MMYNRLGGGKLYATIVNKAAMFYHNVTSLSKEWNGQVVKIGGVVLNTWV